MKVGEIWTPRIESMNMIDRIVRRIAIHFCTNALKGPRMKTGEIWKIVNHSFFYLSDTPRSTYVKIIKIIHNPGSGKDLVMFQLMKKDEKEFCSHVTGCLERAIFLRQYYKFSDHESLL